jgi:hypothetical protein
VVVDLIQFLTLPATSSGLYSMSSGRLISFARRAWLKSSKTKPMSMDFDKYFYQLLKN